MFEFVRLSKLIETSLNEVGLVEPGVLEWLFSSLSLVSEAPFTERFNTGSYPDVPDFYNAAFLAVGSGELWAVCELFIGVTFLELLSLMLLIIVL